MSIDCVWYQFGDTRWRLSVESLSLQQLEAKEITQEITLYWIAYSNNCNTLMWYSPQHNAAKLSVRHMNE